MAQRLLDLIDAPRVVDFRWNTASKVRHDASQAALTRLDLTIPRNVQGWASIRRVVYGRNFAPQVELKMQFYVTITLFLFLLSSAANTLGAASGSSEESLPPDYILVSIIRPIVLSIPVIWQIFLAYKINRFAFSYAEALNVQSLHCAALGLIFLRFNFPLQPLPRFLSCEYTDTQMKTAAALSNIEGHWAEIERLDRAGGMLSAAAAEIESEAESRPMRVIFVKAEPAAASMIISIIMSIIALQIYGMRSLI